MTEDRDREPARQGRRLSRDGRRRQLLATALEIVRTSGADRLTLGHLASSAGVSKPVVYDHFGDRSGLLVELYRWIDTERIETFSRMMASAERGRDETIATLADAYIRCASDLTGEFHVVGAALAGSAEKASVYAELLDQSVAMFVTVLRPFTSLSDRAATQLCIGLVGAGEGLSAAIVRGKLGEDEAIATFRQMIGASVA